MAPAIDSRVFSLIQDNSKAEKKSKFIEQCCRAHGPFDMISSSVCLNVNIIQRRSRKHFTMEDNVFSFFFHLQTTKNTMNISTDRKIFTQNNRRNKNFLQEKKWSDVEWKKKNDIHGFYSLAVVTKDLQIFCAAFHLNDRWFFLLLSVVIQISHTNESMNIILRFRIELSD